MKLFLLFVSQATVSHRNQVDCETFSMAA